MAGSALNSPSAICPCPVVCWWSGIQRRAEHSRRQTTANSLLSQVRAGCAAWRRYPRLGANSDVSSRSGVEQAVRILRGCAGEVWPQVRHQLGVEGCAHRLGGPGADHGGPRHTALSTLCYLSLTRIYRSVVVASRCRSRHPAVDVDR